MDILEKYKTLWSPIYQALREDKLGQSLLFIGTDYLPRTAFVDALVAYILCQSDSKFCGQCSACELLNAGHHPDIHYLRPIEDASTIKIDQIRELQANIYQTPQCGAVRFVIIEPAHKMNTAAANALLKILEEPPSSARFILIADSLNLLPATIVSRCQRYVFPETVISYPPGSKRAELLAEVDVFLEQLILLLQNKSSACSMATKWLNHSLEDVLWFFSWVTIHMIERILINKPIKHLPENIINTLLPLIQAPKLFAQLDTLYNLLEKINHNMNMNQTLTIEHFLLGFMAEGEQWNNN